MGKRTDDKTTRYRLVILLLYAFGMFVQGSNNFVSGTLLPSIVDDLNINPLQSGLLGATTWITTGLFSIPLATFFFWPKYKTKKIIAISTFMATLSIVGQSLAPTYEILFLFRVLYSFFAVLPLAFWVAIRIGWFPKKEYGTVGSISMAFSNLGQFFALGLIPYLLLFTGSWRGIMLIFSVLILVFVVLWSIFGKELKSSSIEKNTVSHKNKNRFPIRGALKYKEVWLTTLSLAGTPVIWQAFFLFYPTYLLTTHNIPLTIGGPIIALFPIGSIVGSLMGGFLSDKVGLRKPFIWPCGIILPILYYLMLQFNNPPILLILSFITGFFAFFFPPSSMAVPLEIQGITVSESSAGLAFVTSTTTFCAVLGPFLTGYIYQITGSLSVALVPMCLTPATLISAFFMKETGLKASSEDSSS